MLNNILKTNQVAPVRIASAPSNISGQIFYTTDYGIFKELLGNRDIDENHVKNLIKQMRQEYLFDPIQVNEKMEIIDGQHRLAACKELGLPVHYFIVKGAGLQQTQKQNALSKKWSMKDVLDSFCKRGFENYLQVRKFMSDTSFTLNHSISILNLTDSGGDVNLNFRNGNFQIKNINKSRIIAKDLIKLREIVNLNDNIIFRAFFYLLVNSKDFDTNVFMQKMEYQSQKFKKQRDRALQIENIEEIYNYKNQNKVNLRIIK